ncbi:hypothetical protein SeMB42_g05297 [Synchytrium endobioticum]|uniref:Secretory carrier membrane protein n=1 Tax=Synchytrium endobioticum TaxID=286115 RepID=A0A507CSB4_9FUNG|nr:hypothetical protein SeLEV6574_g05787 [Synchytrium endobioticum]TPX42050.1 hypothetical protein SeMB42_g05297 [Synchytrium endobioticum]
MSDPYPRDTEQRHWNAGQSQAAFMMPARPNNAYDNAGTHERNLQDRERALDAREKAIAEREKKVGDASFQSPNWPRFRPLVYHDIPKDIPAAGQPLMKQAFALWHLGAVSYIMNFIAAFSLIVTKADGAGSTFGLALVIMVVGIPVSFVFWYRNLYNGVKRDRSINFFFYFINLACHLGAAVFLAIGIPATGGAGLMYALSQFGSNVGSGVLCMLAFVVFVVEVLYGLVVVRTTSRFYRGRGMSLAQAREEGISAAASSRAGQDFAMAAARNAAGAQ